MNQLFRTLFIFSLCITQTICGNQLLVLSIKNLETPEREQQAPLSIIDQPPKRKSKKTDLSGYLALFNGQASISNHDGQILFPRSLVTDTFYILLTSSASPTIYHGNTVDHITIGDKEIAKLYKAARTHNVTNDTYAWNIAEAELPSDNKVPDNCIIIFSQPDGLIIPIGTYATVGDPHLLFPTIFIAPSAQKPKDYLYYLKHSRLYKLIKKIYMDTDTTTSITIDG